MHSALRQSGTTAFFWRFFPLVWLVYLYFPLRELFQGTQPPGVMLLGTAGVCVLLWLWSQLYAQQLYRDGRLRSVKVQWRWALAAYGWCLLLFAGFSLIGSEAPTFLIYAAAVIGFQTSLRRALWGLTGALAMLGLGIWLPGAPYTWIGVVQLVLFSSVGLYGNHAGYQQSLAQRRLTEMQLQQEKLAADAERERIARDLHDLLGHTLSVIVLKSELASKLAERDPLLAAQEIREVERISREALSEVRAAVRGYQGSGLGAELARSKVALDAAGVKLRLERTPCALPPEIENALSMVLREAVTNVVRHARAAHCTVRIEQQGGEYLLDVQDDGIGGAGVEGSGLTGMRERVRALGGELTRSGEGGTCLSARFPVPGVVTAPPVRASA
ncbi:sensor histidine kinase [Deinococcus sp.]|uniref:sensor histidine kinase n=1 Tax=Deinococcus sp. TaxID=47478 RepID=UPI0025EB489B|nr:sensor histidine kinase [Deinococcus sp.]